MRYVYVLVSSPQDFYAEQAAASIRSLKIHEPQAEVVLVSDADTFGKLTGNRTRVKEEISDNIIVEVPASFSPKEKTSFIKTSLREHLEGDILFLDSDTVVAAPLDEISGFKADIGMVADCHAAPRHSRQLRECMLITSMEEFPGNEYYNSGVILVKDSPAARQLYCDWHRLWLEQRERYGISVDQFALALAIQLNPGVVKELPGGFNCQISCPNSRHFLTSARIVHYFATNDFSDSFPLKDSSVLASIREGGFSERVMTILRDPVGAHLDRSLIMSGKNLEFYYSPLSILAQKLARDFPWTNKAVRRLYRLFGFKI